MKKKNVKEPLEIILRDLNETLLFLTSRLTALIEPNDQQEIKEIIAKIKKFKGSYEEKD